MLVYGYTINDFIEYRLESGMVKNKRNGSILRLRCTNKRLFEFILNHAYKGGFSVDELQVCVFECAGLKTSQSRTYGAIKNLQIILGNIEMHHNLICHDKLKGHYEILVNVEPLYIENVSPLSR